MKTNRFCQTLLALLYLLQAGALSAQNDIDDRFVENDVVSLAGKKGFTFNTKGIHISKLAVCIKKSHEIDTSLSLFRSTVCSYTVARTKS